MKLNLWYHWFGCCVLLAVLLTNHVGCAGLLPAGAARDAAKTVGEASQEMAKEAPLEMKLLLYAISLAILGIPAGKGIAFLKMKNGVSADGK